MSQDVDGKVIVRGNAKILPEFVQYFEGEYDDQELGGKIKGSTA